MIEGERRRSFRSNLKYLVIAALVSLLFILVYSRLRPYLQLFRKVVTFLNESSGDRNVDAAGKPSVTAKGKRELIRCEGCGTWIPADRALKLSSGLATFCSRACLEKNAAEQQRRAAG